MPLDPIMAHQAADKVALFAAVREAESGKLTWTAELVREHNRVWFSEHHPGLLAELPHIAEEGVCECGALCLHWAFINGCVIHKCTSCTNWYSVSLDFYRKGVKA
jgi:hypothetical protein